MALRIADPNPDTDRDTDPNRDPYRETGKTCLGGGMHCPSASSFASITFGSMRIHQISREVSTLRFLSHIS